MTIDYTPLMHQLEFANLSDRVGHHHVMRTHLRPGCETFAHAHDFYEFFLVESGQGLHVWQGQNLKIGVGTLVLIRPGDEHYFRTLRSSSLWFTNLAVPAVVWEGFSATLSPTSVFAHALPGHPEGHVILDATALKSCSTVLLDLRERGHVEPTLLPQALSILLGAIIRPLAAWPPVPTLPEWLNSFRRDLADQRLLVKPIEFWQARAGVSSSHFSRSCRRHLGESPTQVLNRARVEWVKMRLRQSDEKISVLALDAGFHNLSFFYRCFKKISGATPKAWLAQQRCGSSVPRQNAKTWGEYFDDS